VSFFSFYKRGLGHPAHRFLLELLNEWELELQHLNPKGVLYLAGFVTLCEGFLGIDPNVNMFGAFFYERGLLAKGDLELELTPVGGSIWSSRWGASGLSRGRWLSTRSTLRTW
jgi:hypothetical protein